MRKYCSHPARRQNARLSYSGWDAVTHKAAPAPTIVFLGEHATVFGN
jgi:hypothetical protein